VCAYAYIYFKKENKEGSRLNEGIS